MFIKYPRTEHLQGSKSLDLGGNFSSLKSLDGYSFSDLSKHTTIVEEKMDGIGLGFGFLNNQIYVQHRGHIYYQQDSASHNAPYYIKDFFDWLLQYEELFYLILEERYVLFGEWLKYKHTVFYNALPSYFMEYDIYDKHNNYFLATNKRAELLQNYKEDIISVHVLYQSQDLCLNDIQSLLCNIKYSIGKNENWRNDLTNICRSNKIDVTNTFNETLNDNLFEGFYIKTENENQVLGRYKWIRKNFIDIILHNDHWKNRPTIYNLEKE